MKLLLVVKMAAGMDVRDILELEGPEQQFITKDALMNDRKVHIQLFKKKFASKKFEWHIWHLYVFRCDRVEGEANKHNRIFTINNLFAID